MSLNVRAAKEHCGYEAAPTLPTCGNCGAFASDFVPPTWVKPEELHKWEDGTYAKVEKNLRCLDHGFSVKKMAACRLWRAKPND